MARILGAGTVLAGFHASCDSGSEAVAEGTAGEAGYSGVLSGGLEPGVRGSDGALQRDSAGVSQTWGGVAGDFGGWGLVS